MISGDPTYPLFSIFSFLGFVLVLIPLPWHFQAWNSGTCLFMIWTGLGCLNYFINSIIWRDNVIDVAPIWCDISTRFTVGLSVAIPAASLCINRRLYKIASCSTVHLTLAHKKRAVLIDLLIGLGIPAIQMPLQFIVQGHRYDIFGSVGCQPTVVNTPAAYPITFVWSTVIGLISAVYCISTLRAFMKRRTEFSRLLFSNNSSLTVNRYFRLMALATVELMFNVPLSSYGLYLNATLKPIYKWKSWSDIHSMWYTIDVLPAAIWRQNKMIVVTLELSRWSVVFCAFLFFAFFGFAQESRKNYRKAYFSVFKRFGYKTPAKATKVVASLASSKPTFVRSKNDTGVAAGTLPVFVPRPLNLASKRASLDSTPSYQESDYTSSTTPTKSELTFPPSPSTLHSKEEDIELALKRPQPPPAP